MKDVVLDNSVVSAFVKIGRLGLLREVLKGSRLYVADTVYREMVFPEARSAVSLGRGSGGWITRIEVDLSGFSCAGIGAGEAGTVKLAKERDAVAVIDDLSGRKLAARHGVAVVGTLALLRLSLDRKLVTKEELASILRDLEEKDSFRMSRKLRDWVLGGSGR